MFHTFLIGLLVTFGPPSSPAPHGPLHLSPADGWAQDAPVDSTVTRWVLSSQGSEARYRVREQLAGFDFPNDAVGATGEVTGAIVLDPEGAIVPDKSEFRVRLSSLTTDNERRDGYVQGRTLEVDLYPEAVLVPRRFTNLPHPLPESGPVSFQLEAELTLHGLTRTTLWEVTAEFGPQAITGLATTAFAFDTFGIALPRVARVLSVEDNIRLELEFRVVPEGGQDPMPLLR